MLLSPFYRCGNQESGNLSNFPKSLQYVAAFPTKPTCPKESFGGHNNCSQMYVCMYKSYLTCLLKVYPIVHPPNSRLHPPDSDSVGGPRLCLSTNSLRDFDAGHLRSTPSSGETQTDYAFPVMYQLLMKHHISCFSSSSSHKLTKC